MEFLRCLSSHYRHLGAKGMSDRVPKQKVSKGEIIGFLGAEHENGGWSPHVHFQISIERPVSDHFNFEIEGIS